jgi:hypothetical protein
MGLFDTFKPPVKILPFPEDLKELKDFDLSKLDYQTKDLGENFFGHFHLKEEIVDGETVYKLCHQYDKLEYIPNPNYDPSKKAKGWSDIQWPTIPKKVGEADDFVNLTATINFYDGVNLNKYENDYWIEFLATFHNGILKDCKLLEFTAKDNSRRKKREAEWKEKREKDARYYKTPLGKIHTFIRRKIVSGVLIKLNNKLSNLIGKVNRFLYKF